MADRVFLHIGTPKSGTTYLQTMLWKNADALRAAGLLLPGKLKLHYAAAKGITARPGPAYLTQNKTDVAWSRLVEQIRCWPGPALISHELLAPATREQAAAATAPLRDAEIHLVLTVRALHRQLPSAWQQQVKAGLGLPYDRFLDEIHKAVGHGRWFWAVQDALGVAVRWGAGVPPEHVHIVTCPTDSSDPTLLWRRYASVMGLGLDGFETDVPHKNVSLGVAETELLRRVYVACDDRFRDPERQRWTRHLLATQVLAKHRGEPIRLPSGAREWIEERTAAMTAGIRSRGYSVMGDLADLGWQPPSGSSRLVTSVTEDELAALAGWVVGRLHEALVERQPTAPHPGVLPQDGIAGILDLLEHIRAADTGTSPRPATGSGLYTHRFRSLVARIHRRLVDLPTPVPS
jgi:hypothetical protein